MICTFLLLAGCLPPVQPAQSRAPGIRVHIYHSKPVAERQDTNLARDAGAAGVTVAGLLMGDSVVLPVLAYFAGQVALRSVERLSDGEFTTVTVDVPVPESGYVVVTVPPDGSVQVLRQGEAVAPPAVPFLGGGSIEDIVERWLQSDPEAVKP